MATKAQVVTIPNAGTTTPTISLEANRFPLGIVIPSAFTGTALTFLASPTEGGTPVAVYNESTLYTVTVSPNRHVSLNQNAFASVKFLQIVSNATESAARNLTLVS